MSELYRIYSGTVFNKYPLQMIATRTFRFDRLTNLERGVGPASPGISGSHDVIITYVVLVQASKVKQVRAIVEQYMTSLYEYETTSIYP